LAKDDRLAETKAVTLYFDKDQRPIFDTILENTVLDSLGEKQRL
jgi:hypothetical protein